MTDFDLTIIKTVLEHQKDNIEDVVVINKGMSNGEVIKALFKPNRITRTDDVVTEEYEFDEVWWNAPYQKGGKE